MENNKKINFDYCSQKKILFICLLVLFMGQKKKNKNAGSLDPNANPNRA